MRIIVATVQVPFVRGGAEIQAEGLRDALRTAGHEAEIVAVPFKWYPPEKILDHILACRLLDLTEVNGTPVDLLIGLKFPAYLVPHPHKVLWIIHQFRTAYDLWDHTYGDLIYQPDGAQVRDAIREADRKLIPEARAVFTDSLNVAKRLDQYCGIKAEPLYHPPLGAEHFYSAQAQEYFFFPSRLCLPKRQKLILEALQHTKQRVRVLFAGTPDSPDFAEELRTTARTLSVDKRVEWLGAVSEKEKLALYANSLGILYPPLDEDYGYVTLEAMLSAKPVITCTDSGGPLEFVRHEETGLVATPEAEAIARAMDHLWTHREQAQTLGKSGRLSYEHMNISWSQVVNKLLSAR
ncbi:MAG TPA: glycosyltransferase family 4 protein [Pyrinomonadaceae bacterium]|nr:glycosyltransferase family 4 protein [Pyrinomonadaceae bacterium]